MKLHIILILVGAITFISAGYAVYKALDGLSAIP